MFNSRIHTPLLRFLDCALAPGPLTHPTRTSISLLPKCESGLVSMDLQSPWLDVLSRCFLFLAPAQLAFAQDIMFPGSGLPPIPLVIGAPGFYPLCQQVQFKVTGGIPPYNLVFAFYGNRQELVRLGSENNTYSWTVDVAPGTPIEVVVSDSTTPYAETVSTGTFTSSPSGDLCGLADIGLPTASAAIITPQSLTGSQFFTAGMSSTDFATSSTTNPPPAATSNPASDSNSSGVSPRVIGFIILGVILFLLAVGILAIWLWRRKKQRSAAAIDLLDETKEVETEDEPARITAFPAPESSPSRPSQENMYERSNDSKLVMMYNNSSEQIATGSARSGSRANTSNKGTAVLRERTVSPLTTDQSPTGASDSVTAPSADKLVDIVEHSVVRSDVAEASSSVYPQNAVLDLRSRREADAGVRLAGGPNENVWVDDNETLPPAYGDIRR